MSHINVSLSMFAFANLKQYFQSRVQLRVMTMVFLTTLLLVGFSPLANAQAVTIVEIDSGALDADRVAGPKSKQIDFEPLISGDNTLRIVWDSNANIRFSVFDTTDGGRTKIATTSSGASPSVWVGTLSSNRTYFMRVWSSSGVANYVATIEAVQATNLTVNTQPANLTVTEGEQAIFTVSATGAGALGYQWLLNGLPIAGENTDTLLISSTEASDDGNGYQVEVSDGTGSTLISETATLSVTPLSTPLQIITQPASITVTEGENASFSVTATGNAILAYQWFENGTAIAGATNSALVLTSTTLAADGTSYTVEISADNNEVAFSTAAVLTVEPLPVTVEIISQPADTVVTEGEDAVFTVNASGEGALGFQWLLNGSPIAGETANTLLIAGTAVTDNGNVYQVEVSDDNGLIISDDAVLTVIENALPPVTSVDIVQSTLDSDRVLGPRWVRHHFEPLATAPHTISVSWDSEANVRFNVRNSGNQNLSSTIRGTNPGVWTGQLEANELYAISIWSANGVANYTVTLTATVPVSIAQQPSNLIVAEGDNANFVVEANGSGTLNYQWLADGNPIPGETADTLTVFATTLSEDGTNYSVQVDNGFDSANSDAATLTVNAQLSLGLFSEEADLSTWVLNGPAPTLDFTNTLPNRGWGRELLRNGDLLLVGGDFEGISPTRGGAHTPRPFLAAIDAVTGQPVPTFQVPVEVNSVVRALSLSPSGDQVYVGGDFGLLALDAVTGQLEFSVSVTEGDQEGRVFDIAVSDTQMYIGGDFSNVAGTFRANIARLSLDGELDTNWSPVVTHGFETGRQAPVQSIALSSDDTVVYVGGNYGFIDGIEVNKTPQGENISLLALNASDGFVRPERFEPAVGNVSKAAVAIDIAVTDFYVIVAWGGPNFLSFHSLMGDRLKQYKGKGDVQDLQVVGDHVFVGHHGEFFGFLPTPIPAESVISLDPEIIAPYKLHSFRIDDPAFLPEQAWQITGPFGVWGIAAAEDSIWVAGQIIMAGSNDRLVDGLVRFPAID